LGEEEEEEVIIVEEQDQENSGKKRPKQPARKVGGNRRVSGLRRRKKQRIHGGDSNDAESSDDEPLIRQSKGTTTQQVVPVRTLLEQLNDLRKKRELCKEEIVCKEEEIIRLERSDKIARLTQRLSDSERQVQSATSEVDRFEEQYGRELRASLQQNARKLEQLERRKMLYQKDIVRHEAWMKKEQAKREKLQMKRNVAAEETRLLRKELQTCLNPVDSKKRELSRLKDDEKTIEEQIDALLDGDAQMMTSAGKVACSSTSSSCSSSCQSSSSSSAYDHEHWQNTGHVSPKNWSHQQVRQFLRDNTFMDKEGVPILCAVCDELPAGPSCNECSTTKFGGPQCTECHFKYLKTLPSKNQLPHPHVGGVADCAELKRHNDSVVGFLLENLTKNQKLAKTVEGISKNGRFRASQEFKNRLGNWAAMSFQMNDNIRRFLDNRFSSQEESSSSSREEDVNKMSVEELVGKMVTTCFGVDCPKCRLTMQLHYQPEPEYPESATEGEKKRLKQEYLDAVEEKLQFQCMALECEHCKNVKFCMLCQEVFQKDVPHGVETIYSTHFRDCRFNLQRDKTAHASTDFALRWQSFKAQADSIKILDRIKDIEKRKKVQEIFQKQAEMFVGPNAEDRLTRGPTWPENHCCPSEKCFLANVKVPKDQFYCSECELQFGKLKC
jgi:hypothetical protein